MKLPIKLEGFDGRGLMLKTAGFFTGPKIFIDGKIPEHTRKLYLLRDNNDKLISIQIKNTFFDPVPRLEVNTEIFHVVRPLRWYEYLWLILPIFITFFGEALGALCGLSAIYASSRIFRSSEHPAWKYLITGFISINAVGLYFIIAFFMNSVIPSFSWQRFYSEEGQFSVSLPGIPSEEKQSAQNSLEITNYTLETDDLLLKISFMDYPENSIRKINANRIIESAMQEVICNTKGELTVEQPFLAGDYPGIMFEVKMDHNNYLLNGRIYLVNSRLYQILIMSKEEDQRKNVEKIFDSFKFKIPTEKTKKQD